MATTIVLFKIRSVNFASHYIKFAYNYIILYIQALSGRILVKKKNDRATPAVFIAHVVFRLLAAAACSVPT